MKYHLAIDIGASSGRHVLGWEDDNGMHLEEVFRFENYMVRENGSLMWDIGNLEKKVKEGIVKCRESGRLPSTVAIDTWGVDYVLLDKDKKPIGGAYAYRDSRTEKIISAAEEIIPFEQLYKITGIQKQSFNTVYQLYCDKLSGRMDNAEYFLMMPDYLGFCLTGKMKNEYTNATTTAMVNAKSFCWDEEIISELGFKKSLFCPLSFPPEALGCFSNEFQKQCGFNAEVILCPSHDTASAVRGSEAGEDDIYISSGTWSLMGVCLTAPILTSNAQKANFTNEGGINKRFRFLKNYMGMWLFQNLKKETRLGYEEMMNAAIAEKEFFIFDVNHGSLSAPENMLGAIENLIGKQPLPVLLNSVYHSLARSYGNAAKEIEDITGKKYNQIVIVGGGSKDRYLNRLTEEYTGKKVKKGPSEATSAGNLITQIQYEKERTI